MGAQGERFFDRVREVDEAHHAFVRRFGPRGDRGLGFEREGHAARPVRPDLVGVDALLGPSVGKDVRRFGGQPVGRALVADEAAPIVGDDPAAVVADEPTAVVADHVAGTRREHGAVSRGHEA